MPPTPTCRQTPVWRSPAQPTCYQIPNAPAAATQSKMFSPQGEHPAGESLNSILKLFPLLFKDYLLKIPQPIANHTTATRRVCPIRSISLDSRRRKSRDPVDGIPIHSFRGFPLQRVRGCKFGQTIGLPCH